MISKINIFSRPWKSGKVGENQAWVSALFHSCQIYYFFPILVLINKVDDF